MTVQEGEKGEERGPVTSVSQLQRTQLYLAITTTDDVQHDVLGAMEYVFQLSVSPLPVRSQGIGSQLDVQLH